MSGKSTVTEKIGKEPLPTPKREATDTTLTPELSRFLSHVHRADRDATLAEASEVLDTLTDAELAVICRAEPGPIVRSDHPALWYSCELRYRLWDEIAELELDCEAAGDSEGWLKDVLKCSA